ncbi:hypothetical protein [Microcystis phage Mwe-JY26]
MKVIWEAEDIIPGRRVSVRKSSEVWLLGYDASIANNNGTSARYCMVSLEDGVVIVKNSTKTELAEHLTTHLYLPIEVLK